MTAERLKTERDELARDISYLQDCIGSMTPDNIRAVRNAVEAAIIAAQGGNKGDRRTIRAEIEYGCDPVEVATKFCEFRDCSWHSAVPSGRSGEIATVCFDLPKVGGGDIYLHLMSSPYIRENGLTTIN